MAAMTKMNKMKQTSSRMTYNQIHPGHIMSPEVKGLLELGKIYMRTMISAKHKMLTYAMKKLNGTCQQMHQLKMSLT
jgi:hypothetical protein